MWKMLQGTRPEDYAVGTGESHSVREFVESAFEYVGLSWSKHVRTDERYFRPTEVQEVRADSAKAVKDLNWNPRIRFDDLVKIMLDAEMRRTGMKPVGEGDRALEKAFPQKWWLVD
jgi:GDPmannose 4,6-dehydratase